MANATSRKPGLRGVLLLGEFMRNGALSVVTSDGDRPAMLTRVLPDGNIIHKIRPDTIGTLIWHAHIEAVSEHLAALNSILSWIERLLFAQDTLRRHAIRLAFALGSLGALLGALRGVVTAAFATLVGLLLPALARFGLRQLRNRIMRRLLVAPELRKATAVPAAPGES